VPSNAGGDTFVFASDHSTIENAAGATASGAIEVFGGPATPLQEAQDQHITLQGTSKHGFGGFDSVAGLVPTDVEIADLHAKGFVFH
jgi:hypothetical protein